MFNFSCVEIQADRSQSESRQFSGVLFMEDCDQPYPSDLVQNLTWIWVAGGRGVVETQVTCGFWSRIVPGFHAFWPIVVLFLVHVKKNKAS